jgi:hypothetical protein
VTTLVMLTAMPRLLHLSMTAWKSSSYAWRVFFYKRLYTTVMWVLLPAEENCKRSIRRHRPQLPSPSSLQQLSIPPEFAVTLDEDQQPFLFYNNGPDARTRVIAFGSCT